MKERDDDGGAPFTLELDTTWTRSVELFQTDAASWLTPADAPQLMALRAIAKQLDDGKFQAALISQFTLIHRSLREKGDPARAAKSTAPTAENDDGAILDMFKNNPGAMWRGDQ